MQEAGTGVGVQRSRLANPAAIILGANAPDRAAIFEKKLKQKVIKEAATQVAIQTVLMFIPIVGQILSLAYGAVVMINDNKAKKEIAKAKDRAEMVNMIVDAYAEMKQQELIELLNRVYQRAYKEAVSLALSWQPLVLEDEREVMRRVFNQATFKGFRDEGGMEKQAAKDMDKMRRFFGLEIGDRDIGVEAAQQMEGLGIFGGAMGGVAGFITKQTNTQAQMKILEINRQINPVIDRLNQSAFQAFLAKKLAVEMRTDPTFMEVAAQLGAPPPTKFVGVGEPTTGSQPIPGPGTRDISASPPRNISATGSTPIPSTTDPQVRGRIQSVDQPAAKAQGKTNLLLIGGAAAAAFLLLR